MKLFPTNKNSIALLCTGVVSIGLFIAGMFKVLDYPIIKALLFVGFAILFFIAVVFALKNDIKKNRPGDKLQDDSH